MHESFVADNPITSPPLAAAKNVTREIEEIVFSSFIKC